MLQEQRTITELGRLLIVLFSIMVNLMGEMCLTTCMTTKPRWYVVESLKLLTYLRLVGLLQMTFKRRSKSFEQARLNVFAINDSTKETRCGFEEWFDLPHKGMKVLDVLCEFESKFNRLSTRDQTVLQPEKFIMFPPELCT
jgi:hypothetical protein